MVATALLDRLLHYAVVVQIEGARYRLRQHADLMPEHLRFKPLLNPSFPGSRSTPPRTTVKIATTRSAGRLIEKLGNFTSA